MYVFLFVVLVTMISQSQCQPTQNSKLEDSSSPIPEPMKNSTVLSNGTRTNTGNVPRKMSEGMLIATLFNLGTTLLNDFSNEVKFLRDLQQNGTDINKMMLNETAVNATKEDYQRIYYRRYGHHYHYHHGYHCNIGGGDHHHYLRAGRVGTSFKTAMIMKTIPSIAKRVTTNNKFGHGTGHVTNKNNKNNMWSAAFKPVAAPSAPGWVIPPVRTENRSYGWNFGRSATSPPRPPSSSVWGWSSGSRVSGSGGVGGRRSGGGTRRG